MKNFQKYKLLKSVGEVGKGRFLYNGGLITEKRFIEDLIGFVFPGTKVTDPYIISTTLDTVLTLLEARLATISKNEREYSTSQAKVQAKVLYPPMSVTSIDPPQEPWAF